MLRALLYLFLPLSSLFLLAGRAAPEPPQGSAPLQQGITGKIFERRGNFMPGPDQPQTLPGQPAVRKLVVFALTNLSQVKKQDDFYRQIPTKQIATVISRPDGSFALFLKPGTYSLFTRERGGYFANRSDGQGNIFPVVVKPNQVTPVEFIIDYNASY